MRPLLRAMFALVLLTAAGHASAHKASDSFLQLTVAQDAISGRWDIALRDLDFAIGLDADADGAITWGEVRRSEAAIEAYALSRLVVLADGKACSLQAGPLQIAEHSDGRYASLGLEGRCAAAPSQLRLDYALLFDVDAQHRGLQSGVRRQPPARRVRTGSPRTALPDRPHRKRVPDLSA